MNAERPNILFIITDDQREGMEVMPNTVQLFKHEGRRYPNAFVTTPLCCPSRSSIMTGDYAHNHGVKSNSSSPLQLAQEDTLQAKLEPLGYSTAYYGKYLNGWPTNTAPPHFDDFGIIRNGYIDTTWNVNGEVGTVPGYTTDIVGDKAVDFVHANENSGDPWLMYVAPYAPHAPFTAEPAYEDALIDDWRGTPAMREEDRSDKPWFFQRRRQSLEGGLAVRAAQFRALMSVDDMVGRLFEALSSTGQADNTLAVYISDNGFMWGDHGLKNKGVPYTGAVNVPMFARWPQGIAPGTKDGRLVANIDLAPTVLSVLGQATGELDGRDLLDTSWKRDRIHLEYWCNVKGCQPWLSTRSKRYQYTEYLDHHSELAVREYYDLKADPWQLQNLFGDRNRKNDPDVEPLQARLYGDAVCSGTTTLAPCP